MIWPSIPFLLLLCSAASRAVAQTPTFVAGPPDRYEEVKATPPPLAPTEVAVRADDAGVEVWIGADRYDKLAEAVKRDCDKLSNPNCIKNAGAALGLTPEEDGIQRRVAPVAILAVAAAFVALAAYLIHKENDNNKKHTVLVMPSADIKPMETWSDAKGFVFKTASDATDSVYISLTDSPTPDRTEAPSASTVTSADKSHASGDVVIHLPPDVVTEMKKALDGLICKRALSVRQNRDPPPVQCLVPGAQAILRAAQVGGPLAHLRGMTNGQMPAPNPQAIQRALQGLIQYGHALTLFVSPEILEQMALLALWIAYDYFANNHPVSADAVIPVKDINRSPTTTSSKRRCPKPTDKPFCDNCRGDKDGTGKCVGFPDGDWEDCSCYRRNDLAYDPVSLQELLDSFKEMRNWPNIGDAGHNDDGDGFPKTNPKCVGPGAKTWVYREVAFKAAEAFCNNEDNRKGMGGATKKNDDPDIEYTIDYPKDFRARTTTKEECMKGTLFPVDNCDHNDPATDPSDLKRCGEWVDPVTLVKYTCKAKNGDVLSRCYAAEDNPPRKAFVDATKLDGSFKDWCGKLAEAVQKAGGKSGSFTQPYFPNTEDSFDSTGTWGEGVKADDVSKLCLDRSPFIDGRCSIETSEIGDNQFNWKFGFEFSTFIDGKGVEIKYVPTTSRMPITTGDNDGHTMGPPYQCRAWPGKPALGSGGKKEIKKSVLQKCLAAYVSWDNWDGMNCGGIMGFFKGHYSSWHSPQDCSNRCKNYLSQAIEDGATAAMCNTCVNGVAVCCWLGFHTEEDGCGANRAWNWGLPGGP